MTSTPLPASLESILGEIQKALNAKLYYPALIANLTLPEICVGLELPPESRTVKKNDYIGFIDKHGGGIIAMGVNGEQCYQLRCGLVHRGGSAAHPENEITHYIFTTPESGSTVHGVPLVDQGGAFHAKFLDIIIFCSSMRDAVKTWHQAVKHNPKVALNAERILSLRPDGVFPIVVGRSVLATGAAMNYLNTYAGIKLGAVAESGQPNRRHNVRQRRR